MGRAAEAARLEGRVPSSYSEELLHSGTVLEDVVRVDKNHTGEGGGGGGRGREGGGGVGLEQ
jgi:hypothetical protein